MFFKNAFGLIFKLIANLLVWTVIVIVEVFLPFVAMAGLILMVLVGLTALSGKVIGLDGHEILASWFFGGLAVYILGAISLFTVIKAWSWDHCCTGMGSFWHHFFYHHHMDNEYIYVALAWPVSLRQFQGWLLGWGMCLTDVFIGGVKNLLIGAWRWRYVTVKEFGYSGTE